MSRRNLMQRPARPYPTSYASHAQSQVYPGGIHVNQVALSSSGSTKIEKPKSNFFPYLLTGLLIGGGVAWLTKKGN